MAGAKAGKYVKYRSYMVLAGAFFVLYLFVNHRMDNVLDSDIATQLVLSKLLQEEGQLLSSKWYYATELRILGYNLFFAPFFHFSSNWRLVRTVGSMAAFLLLLASIFYFCAKMHLQKYFVCLGTVFLLPFSEQYYSFVLKNINYVPFLTVSFFSMGLLFDAAKAKTKKKKALLCTVLSVLAFFAGLGGFRQLYITYVPMFLAGICDLFSGGPNRLIVDRLHLKYAVYSFLAVICSLAGYAVNSLYLAGKYHFSDYGTVRWNAFSIAKFGEVVAGIFANLGFSSEPMLSLGALHSLFSFFLFGFFLYAAYRILKKKEDCRFESRILVYFIICAFGISVFLYGFTTMSYAPRYDLLWEVFCFPVIAASLCEEPVFGTYKKWAVTGAAVIMGICCVDAYARYFQADTTSELRNIAGVLCEKGYKEGYATFWNANIMTELSNGYLEVWDWADTSYDFDTVDQTYKWADFVRHDTKHPEGKVFWILTEEQEKNFHFVKAAGEGHVLYRTPEGINDGIWDVQDRLMHYVVYGFSSYEQMYALTSNYMDGERLIQPAKVAESAATTLYPGTYFFFCRGEGLSELDISCQYNRIIRKNKKAIVEEKPSHAVLQQAHTADGYCCFTFLLEEEARDFKIIYRNQSRENGKKIFFSQIIKNGAWYVDFYDGIYLRNGYDDFGVRHLSQGGESFGPYITLAPGAYTVTCKGEGLPLLSFDSVFLKDGKLVQLKKKHVSVGDGQISYEVFVDDAIENFEARFFNHTGQEVKLTELRIQRK